MSIRTPACSLRILALAATALLAAASSGHANETTVLPDTSRVASIGGAITEIVYALGEEKKLAARDSTSVYPEAALGLPDVGYMRRLSPEGVLSVNPTGILALQGSGPKETIDVLKKASVPYVEIEESWDHAGIVERIRAVGQAIGAPAKAEELALKVDGKLKQAEDLTAGVKERKRVLFILSMQGGKILASGSNTAANGIIELAGAVNAVEGYEGYKQLTDEAAIAARPDVILMMVRGGEHDSLGADLFAHPAIAGTPAGQEKKLIKMDGAYLLGFGPRTADAITELAHSLYGDQVKD
ncbi:heme/hemin ABC transporter substrate-binding protein [Arvimicrobium flavum]|uniref:heme/hemin ABC transporter substrate-binding protein n=1 Tax=Arvimicrobium flavum TaxID=3393320 RepID=UPI00237BB3BF|nr:hemin ABC transporter substrate-binding protein [Mesorhizobium shangrilense]